LEGQIKLKLNPVGAAGALLVGVLAVGTFAAGTHFGTAQTAGHNLYQPPPPSAPASAVILASAARPGQASSGQVTQEADGPGTSHDSAGAGDSGGPGDTSTGFQADTSPAATFDDVYQLIERNFVDPLPTDTQMAHGAATAMLASLQDPDSRFLEAPEVSELDSEAKGQYRGIGAALAVRRLTHPKVGEVPAYTEYRLVLVAPLPGSPAEKAGLQPGDMVTTINGQWIYNDSYVYAQTKALKAVQDDPVTFNKMLTALQKKIDGSLSIAQAQTKLADPAAKTIVLTVTRAGQPQPLSVSLDTAAPTVVSPITARSLPGGIGYIKIAQFTPGADKDFETALAGFGNAPKGLVLDLRNSPGGMLDVGAAIASQISSAPALGYLETKGKKVQPISDTPSAAVSCPIVVLVNGGTANTAELLASALQSKGAKLVGSTTFGDASDVKLITLHDGSGFTMTVGKLMTAAHGDFGGLGIKPDVVLPNTSGDAPLDRAVDVLSGRVARVPSAHSLL
jgi:carboxyl-terminal processing protease